MGLKVTYGRRLGDNARRRPHRQARRRIAAHMLECAEEDPDYAGAIYSVRGTDRQITFRDVADNAYHVRYCRPGPTVL